MTIYFAINEFEDLESHFDLEGVYFSKEDLFKDLETIRKEGYNIYSVDASMFTNYKLKGSSLNLCNMSKILEEFNEQEEYGEYLRLKAKFEHESTTLDEAIKLEEESKIYYVTVYGESVTLDDVESEHTVFKGTKSECDDYIDNL